MNIYAVCTLTKFYSTAPGWYTSLCSYIVYFQPLTYISNLCYQENDSKRARALKKAAEEREMRRTKDREIARYVNFQY